jgi:MFS family permease
MATQASALPMQADLEQQRGGYPWYVLFVLILAYTVSFIDRQALTLMVDPIRASLDISDTQLSLLHGFAFAIFYSIMGIPIGRLVDKRKRTYIIAAGIVVWSLMTAACGLARNFIQMFIARVGVGVGEAALSPGAYSLIADYFPKRRLPLALSIYTSAAYAGSGLAIMIGGTIIALMPAMTLPLVGALEPWQAVFIAIGLPGLLVALLVLFLREPARTSMRAGEHPGIGELLRHIGNNKGAYLLTMVGYALSGMLWNGALAWFPTFLMRGHGWSPGDVGLYYGLTLFVAGTAGILTGGALGSRMRARGREDANIVVGLIALALAVPFGVAGMFAPTGGLAMAGIALFLFATCMPWGCAAAAMQEITPNQMRGQISAIYLFFLNFIGLAFGPTLIALFTDGVYGNDQAVGLSIASVMVIAAPISAAILMLARRPYREALARIDF